jgi:hypothetical protein
MIIIDADDFHEGNAKLDVLEALHYETGMKFNLFTVVGLCSDAFIKKVKAIDYIDMIPHGWLHPTPRECEKWTYNEAFQYLFRIDYLKLTRGFKAPGWQISAGTYRALLDFGYWVADQHYNDTRRPPELPVFFHKDEHHFHIGHMGGHNDNEISYHLPRLLQMKGEEFGFIKDVL